MTIKTETPELKMPKIYPYKVYRQKRFADTGVYEFVGPQRGGKTTLEVAILLLVFLRDVQAKFRQVQPKDVWTNFPIDIKGINCTNNEGIEWVLEKIKNGDWQHKIVVLGEASQFLFARNFRSMEQTKLVTSIWQWPKKDIIFMYESNPGSSVDVIMRDGTWFTMPCKYIHGATRAEDQVRFDVIANYECWVNKNLYFHSPAWIQGFFASFSPVR